MKTFFNVYREIFEDKTVLGSIFIGIPEAILYTVFAPVLLIALIPMYPIMMVFNSDKYQKFEQKLKDKFYKPY